MRAWLLIGVFVFWASFVFNVLINGKRVQNINQVTGLVLIQVFTLFLWPICLLAFGFGLLQRFKIIK